MNAFIKKKYILSPKEYDEPHAKAALKTIRAKKLSLKHGKKLAYKLIDKWAKEK